MLITPEEAEKLVELNAAIPFVVPSAAALSIVIVEPDVTALLSVNAPVIADDPPDDPVIESTPLLEITTVPPSETGEPETPIPLPAETVIAEF